MAHPFEALFEKALKKSIPEENMVFREASKLIEKGYRKEEVCGVLVKLEKSLIDSREAAVVHEAIEELCEDEE